MRSMRFFVVCAAALVFPGLQSGCTKPPASLGIALAAHHADGRHAVLVPSLHLLPKGVEPLPSWLRDAVKSADVLAVELDVTDPAVLEKSAACHRIAGERVRSALIGQKWADEASSLFREAGLPNVVPGATYALLADQLAALAQRKALPTLTKGVDFAALDVAVQQGIKVVPLEDACDPAQAAVHAAQVWNDQNIAERFEYARSAAFETTAAELGRTWQDGVFTAMEKAWTDGHASRPAEAKAIELFIDARNVHLVAALDKLLLSYPKGVVVLIGAGHFVGPNSVVQELKKKGYQVTVQPANGTP
jgi:uncharacterized protein